MEFDTSLMEPGDQDKIEAIKKRYRETSVVREPSGFLGHAHRIRSGGMLLGRTGAILIGMLFLVVGINFMRTPVEYIIWGDKVSATAIRYDDTVGLSGFSRSRVPVVSFYHDGKKCTALLRYYGDIYLNQRMVVRYLADSPATVIAEWPIKSLLIYSVFLVFGAGLIYLIVRYEFNTGDELSPLPRDDCMQPIDAVVRGMSPEKVQVFVMEPSRTVRIVLMVIALVIAGAGGFHVYAVSDRVTELWRLCAAAGFYAIFVAGITLLVVRRQKTTVNMHSGTIEQQAGIFVYGRIKRWPVSRFSSVRVKSRSAYDHRMRSHTTYILMLEGPSRKQDLMLNSYADGIDAAFQAKKLSTVTGLPVHPGQ